MQEIHDLDTFLSRLQHPQQLQDVTVQALDLSQVDWDWTKCNVQGAIFLGCELGEFASALQKRGAIIFPKLGHLPFSTYRAYLYTADELFDGFQPDAPSSYCDTPDALIYQHWRETGGAQPEHLQDVLARRLHDLAIEDGVKDFLRVENRSDNVVAIMGGHSMLRTGTDYRKIALTSRELTRQGYLMTTGGGPGAMEATHLGVQMASYDDAALDDALQTLATAPSYRDEKWLAAAWRVREKYPDTGDYVSLGIPTWLYGHEPPNPFASHIAKFFANSVREAGLVTIAKRGIIFAPGSAGTIQEIFQDATQNHYGTLGIISPMLFFDTEYWTREKPVYPLLQQLAAGRQYSNLLGIVDEVVDAVDFVNSHPPEKYEGKSWSFCQEFGASPGLPHKQTKERE